MLRRTFPRTLSIVFAWASLAAAAPAPEPPPPVHVDAKDLEQAVLDATRAFVHGDAPGMRAAFDRVEKDCRRLGPDDEPARAHKMVDLDASLHAGLDRARESASRGDLDAAFESMRWVMRGCRACHELRDTSR